MFHAGFAWELSKTLVEDRVERSGRRFLSSGDRGRIAARDERERSNRIFEQVLSLAGASALLALVSFGVGGVLFVAIAAIAVAIGVTGRRSIEAGGAIRPPADPQDRWGVWRRIEPDPEYLRGRA